LRFERLYRIDATPFIQAAGHTVVSCSFHFLLFWLIDQIHRFLLSSDFPVLLGSDCLRELILPEVIGDAVPSSLSSLSAYVHTRASVPKPSEEGRDQVSTILRPAGMPGCKPEGDNKEAS
jgi:hypothetical protein